MEPDDLPRTGMLSVICKKCKKPFTSGPFPMEGLSGPNLLAALTCPSCGVQKTYKERDAVVQDFTDEFWDLASRPGAIG
jgi:hypothetical protein